MTVHIRPALSDDAETIQNLMQLYTHDFSEYWAGTDNGELGADGRFAPYPLSPYWHRPDWQALLLYQAEALAGFALINDHSHAAQPTDHNLAEFFVLRKYRGVGVGRMAASQLFTNHPGQWEVAVARKNIPAYRFWRKTITSLAIASNIQEIDAHDDGWNGPIIRFLSRITIKNKQLLLASEIGTT